MEHQEEVKSRYSSGLNIIFRLDNLWRDTHLHSRNDRFYKWNNDLDCIWRELVRDLDNENYTKWKNKIDEIDDKLRKLGGFQDTPPDGFTKTPPELIKKREEQYKLISEKQLILARLENELGKGTTYEDMEDDDFD